MLRIACIKYVTPNHVTCIRISFQTMQYVSGSHSNQHHISLHVTADHAVPVPTGDVFVAGFFENKEADAKARGQKLPKKKDPKQEYDNFLKSIADDVQEVEARQEVEAVEAAQDKADQEAFEHGCALGPCISCTSQSCVTQEPCPFAVFDDVLALGWHKHMQTRGKVWNAVGVTVMQSDSCMIVCHSCILSFAR